MFEMGLAKVYPCTEFEVSIASPVPNLRVLKLKFGPCTLTIPPFCGHFVLHEMGLATHIDLTNLKFLSSLVPKIRHNCSIE